MLKSKSRRKQTSLKIQFYNEIPLRWEFFLHNFGSQRAILYVDGEDVCFKGFSKVAEIQPEPSQTKRNCSPLSRPPPSSFWFVGKLNFFLLAVFKPTEKACGASHLAVYAGFLPSENRYMMILKWVYEIFKQNLRWCGLFLPVEHWTGHFSKRGFPNSNMGEYAL